MSNIILKPKDLFHLHLCQDPYRRNRRMNTWTKRVIDVTSNYLHFAVFTHTHSIPVVDDNCQRLKVNRIESETERCGKWRFSCLRCYAKFVRWTCRRDDSRKGNRVRESDRWNASLINRHEPSIEPGTYVKQLSFTWYTAAVFSAIPNKQKDGRVLLPIVETTFIRQLGDSENVQSVNTMPSYYAKKCWNCNMQICATLLDVKAAKRSLA